MDSLVQEIRELSRNSEGRLGVCACTLDGQVEVHLSADDIFPTASSIKIYVLYTLLAGIARKQYSLEERIELSPDDLKPGSGVLYHLAPGLNPSLMDLATLMMMISDNTALNLLTKYLGLETINEQIQSLGLVNSYIGDWSRFETSYANSIVLGRATPREFVEFLSRMWRGELLNDEMRDIFWDTLRIQKYIVPLRKYLPASPWAREFNMPEPVWVASKGGALDDCCCENGLVCVTGGGWFISIMFSNLPTTEIEMHEELISLVSKLIYSAWAPLFPGEKP